MIKISLDKIRSVIYVILLAAAVVWASFYGGVLPFSCLFLLLLYPVYAFGIALYTHWAFHLSQSLSDHKIEKKVRYPYHISIENAFIFPIVKVKLNWEEDLTSIREADRISEVSLDPGECVEYTVHISCLYAGTYQIGIKSYEIKDPFGILKFLFFAYDPYRVIVRPQLSDLADSVLSSKLYNIGFIPDPQNTDNTLGADIRRYVNGDSLKTVDWKRYARTDELYVRMYEETGLKCVHIFVERMGAPANLDEFKRRDMLLEFTVSAADWFAKRQTVAFIHYVSRDPEVKNISDNNSLQRFISAFCEEISYKADEKADELQRNAYGSLTLAKEQCFIVNESQFPDGDLMIEAKEALI